MMLSKNNQMGLFYDTVDYGPEELEQYRDEALNQDERCLAFFKAQYPRKFTVDQINALVFPNSPRSSAARSINTLMNNGLVFKSGKVDGDFKRKVYLFQFNIIRQINII